MTQEQTEKKVPFRKNRFRVEIQANDKSGFNRALEIDSVLWIRISPDPFVLHIMDGSRIWITIHEQSWNRTPITVDALIQIPLIFRIPGTMQRLMIQRVHLYWSLLKGLFTDFTFGYSILVRFPLPLNQSK